MTTSVEQSVELLAGETEVLGENVPQCRFVHHKSHMELEGYYSPPLSRYTLETIMRRRW
jgi:hypothetical protein